MNYNKIYLISSTILGANLYLNFLPKFALFVLGGAWLILSAFAYSKKLEEENIFIRLSLGLCFILAIVAIIGSIFFYTASLLKFFILICFLIIFWKTKDVKLRPKIPKIKFHTAYCLLSTAYLLLASFIIYLYIKSAGDGAIKSPWLELPPYFLVLFWASALLLLFLLRKNSSPTAVSLHFFLFFGAAAFIYKLGYGFDIFNHEAAIKYILEHGTITPKPFQYIGLYAMEIFLHRLTGLPISWLLKFLLPALTILIPPIAFYSIKKQRFAPSPLPVLSLLLLPLSYFIVTTPQGLANIFLLFFIFLSLAGLKIWWIAPAALFIHPITGILSLIYLAFLKSKKKCFVFVGGSLVLPLSFIILSYILNGRLMINFYFKETAARFWSLLSLGGIKQNYQLWLDLLYFIKIFFLPAIIAVSFWTAQKFKKEISRAPFFAFLTSQTGFFLMSIFTDFSYLISYEQKNYPERLFYASFLFLAPYLLLAASHFVSFLKEQGSKPLKIFFAFLFAFAITANFYLAYPRWDNYENDKGKNVTAAMIAAVELIEKDAGGKNYVVLTDQATSAAALKTFGFKKYYKTPLGEIFYYPIPTGGPLYNEFLNLIYNDAGAGAAANAKNLTGADLVYVALPSYWENYEKIKENLKTGMRTIFEDKNLIILK